jgi:hypothetical protein
MDKWYGGQDIGCFGGVVLGLAVVSWPVKNPMIAYELPPMLIPLD